MHKTYQVLRPFTGRQEMLGFINRLIKEGGVVTHLSLNSYYLTRDKKEVRISNHGGGRSEDNAWWLEGVKTAGECEHIAGFGGIMTMDEGGNKNA